jgi:methylmalonyl-CoA/ethylmalonyl-CoA epimerase
MNRSDRMTKLEHVGIATISADAVAAVFEALFGRRPYARELVGREGVRTTFIEAGPVKLELLEVVDPESALARSVERRGPGLHHLAFEVEDLEAAHARLEAAGFRLLGEPAPGADRKRIFFIHPKDTAGVLVECCESMPGGATALSGSGPEGAPPCLVIAEEDEWDVVRALARRMRVWHATGGVRATGAPHDSHLVVFGADSDAVAGAPAGLVLVDPLPDAVPADRPDALVISREGRDLPEFPGTLVRLPRSLLARLPDPATTLADVIAAHLIA